MSSDDRRNAPTRIVALCLAVLVVGSVAAAGLALGAVPLTSMDGDAAAAQQESASVRVVHASPDAPPVDVAVDGQTVLENVSFGNVSDYLEVEPGNRTVAISLSGDNETLFEGSLALEAGTSYTVAAAGESSDVGPTEFGPVVYLDNATTPADNESSVRLAHLSPDAPAVDVTVEGTDTVLFDNVSFRNSSGYVTVPAGNYTLEVRPATANDSGDVVATFAVSLEGGTAYTAFAAGYLNPEEAASNVPFQLLVGADATVAPSNATATPTGTETEGMGETATPTGTETEEM